MCRNISLSYPEHGNIRVLINKFHYVIRTNYDVITTLNAAHLFYSMPCLTHFLSLHDFKYSVVLEVWLSHS